MPTVTAKEITMNEEVIQKAASELITVTSAAASAPSI
jgi:hypothetical protein